MSAVKQQEMALQQDALAKAWEAAQVRDQQAYRQAELARLAEARRIQQAQFDADWQNRMQAADTAHEHRMEEDEYGVGLRTQAQIDAQKREDERARTQALALNAQLLQGFAPRIIPRGLQTGTRMALQEQMALPPMQNAPGAPEADPRDAAMRAMSTAPLSMGLQEVQQPVMTPASNLNFADPLVQQQMLAPYLAAGGQPSVVDGQLMFTGVPLTPEQRAAEADAAQLERRKLLADVMSAENKADLEEIDLAIAEATAPQKVKLETFKAALEELKYLIATDADVGEFRQAQLKVAQAGADLGMTEAQIYDVYERWRRPTPGAVYTMEGQMAMQERGISARREDSDIDYQREVAKWQADAQLELDKFSATQEAKAAETADKHQQAVVKAAGQAARNISRILADEDMTPEQKQKAVDAELFAAESLSANPDTSPVIQQLRSIAGRAAGIGPAGGAPAQQLSNGYTVGPAGAAYFADVPKGEVFGKRYHRCARYVGEYIKRHYDPNAPIYDAEDYDDKYFSKSPLWQEIDPMSVSDPSQLVDAVFQWDTGKRGFGGKNMQHTGFGALAPGNGANPELYVVSNEKYRVSARDLERARVWVYVGPNGGRRGPSQPSASSTGPSGGLPSWAKPPSVPKLSTQGQLSKPTSAAASVFGTAKATATSRKSNSFDQGKHDAASEAYRKWASREVDKMPKEFYAVPESTQRGIKQYWQNRGYYRK
jgi:hypothetical protein